MEKGNTQEGKSKRRKFIFIGVGTAAAGILGYFGWQWWKDKKESKEQENWSGETPIDFSQKPNLLPPVMTLPKRNDGFPLKKGSKGPKVKALQEMLIAKYGKSTLPRYGADGDFGSEMEAALKKLNLPESIDESTYNVLTKGNAIDPAKVSVALYTAASSKNFNQVLFTLKGMKNTDDYSSVSNDFKTKYRIGGVHKTLVNGLLDSFSDEAQKQQIRIEFIRMGLKYDGSKWSLAGLEGVPRGQEIVTTKVCKIYKHQSHYYINVPKDMIVGRKEYTRQGKVYFKINGTHELYCVDKDKVKDFKPLTKSKK